LICSAVTATHCSRIRFGTLLASRASTTTTTTPTCSTLALRSRQGATVRNRFSDQSGSTLSTESYNLPRVLKRFDPVSDGNTINRCKSSRHTFVESDRPGICMEHIERYHWIVVKTITFSVD
jgi:hypothetical protein